jgi:MHS family alpha-ketoglutarate permease-like MFS transporter
MEWYDWGVYGFFAPVFAAQFFPSKVPIVSLLLTLGTFALGFFMRPIGGVVLGAYGDRAGRRNALALQILIMAGASLVIGVIPGYSVIGLLAPLVLLLARLAQGFSAGGEFGASSAFLVEYARPDRRGLIGSIQQVSVGLGTLIASAVASVVLHNLPAGALHSWGWRIPFWLGAAVGLFGLYLRLRVGETPSFVRIDREQRTAGNPFLEMFAKYPRDFWRVFGITIAGTLTYYMWVLFLPTYAEQTTHLSLAAATLANTIALIVFVACIPLAAALSDRVGRRPLLLGFALGFLVLSYPLFTWIRSGSVLVFFIVEIIGLLLITGYSGTTATVMAEQFPTRVRNTGIAVPYALAVAIFGGTAPFVTTWLIEQKALTLVPLYVMASALVSGLVYLFMRETFRTPLDTEETSG